MEVFGSFLNLMARESYSCIRYAAQNWAVLNPGKSCQRLYSIGESRRIPIYWTRHYWFIEGQMTANKRIPTRDQLQRAKSIQATMAIEGFHISDEVALAAVIDFDENGLADAMAADIETAKRLAKQQNRSWHEIYMELGHAEDEARSKMALEISNRTGRSPGDVHYELLLADSLRKSKKAPLDWKTHMFVGAQRRPDWDRIKSLGLRPDVRPLAAYGKLVLIGIQRAKYFLRQEPNVLLPADIVARVHREMFGRISPWAGQFRRGDFGLGSAPPF
jgi:hypothetical protein